MKTIHWLLGLTGCLIGLHCHAEIPLVISTEESSAVQIAGEDLRRALSQVYPQERFPITAELPATGPAVLLGRIQNPRIREMLGGVPSPGPEGYVVRKVQNEGREVGVIAGSDSLGTAYGVYGLLEKLGCGFTLSGDLLPAPAEQPFSFAGWDLTDQPLTGTRLVFDWHNFLSGCSTWNLEDWKRWTAQSRKMGYNAIMVHAYGNNPMATFDFQGVSKPVGYLSTTAKGRDWSTMHVNDVRRLVGGDVFSGPVFGSEAALVPDTQRVTAAQELMHQVFADATRRGMGVYFAVDVDTPSANPQDMIRRLPESARFPIKASSSVVSGEAPETLWLPNPDTPEGYDYFRAQVNGLLRVYPDVTTLVVWFRRDATPWTSLKTNVFPQAWKELYAAELRKTPAAANLWQAPGLFALSRIVRAFERILQEQGSRTRVAAGSWSFGFLPAADRFFPSNVPLIALDYEVIHERPQLGTESSRALIREVAAQRPVVPVVWAHHDDGHYIGRPYTPLPEFSAKLMDARAAGFGIIHWTTRPLDLYFTSLSKQVWQATKDESLATTCRRFAAASFGERNQSILGEYLLEWITKAPRFARETSDWFIDRRLTNIEEVVAGCAHRRGLLEKASRLSMTPEQTARLEYYAGLEEFIGAFHQAHGAYQESVDLLNQGDLAGARAAMKRCSPEPVIKQFAEFSSKGGITRGEQGLVVSLNTRWLSHIVRHKQALGLEPVRIDFAPTSHDKLAQSRGTFTFYFGPQHEIWECRGEEETGAKVFTLPNAPGMAATADLPESWREVTHTGIEFSRPLHLSLGPIMAKDSRRKGKLALLPAARYRLHLLMLDPDVNSGKAVVEVRVQEGEATRLDFAQPEVGIRRISNAIFPVELTKPGMVEVTLTPKAGRGAIVAAILQPVD